MLLTTMPVDIASVHPNARLRPRPATAWDGLASGGSRGSRDGLL